MAARCRSGVVTGVLATSAVLGTCSTAFLSVKQGKGDAQANMGWQAAARDGAKQQQLSSPSTGAVAGSSMPVAAALLAAAVGGVGGFRDGGRKTARKDKQDSEVKQFTPGPVMSQALPWSPVPNHLTNDLMDPLFPGDAGFDPLSLGADAYVSEVCQNLGFKFNAMRWYRESELMHGRVAMLATFNLILRAEWPETVPDSLLEQKGIWNFIQVMVMLEAFRGQRLFIDADRIAGDLGLGSQRTEATREQLIEKQYKEVQNGRLAMLAFAGMLGQYMVTGRTVGVDYDEVTRFEQAMVSSIGADDGPLRDIIMTVLGAIMAVDGIRRLSNPSKEATSIAAKALNPVKLSFGVQDPGIPLPAGVVTGQAPQAFHLSEEQLQQFEEDGVIMIKGAMKEWVQFLRGITDFQIERPHVWSLVGRMSGLYDYIQRNTWMTNNGFRDFLYYSPLGHVASQLARTSEVRCSTDLLLVNPNKGFGWHQDNQNGPITHQEAIRWWVAMDRCGENDYGAPEYLLGSQNNNSVSGDAVFVNMQDGDLASFTRKSKFVPEPGDLIIWHARTIHRIVAPPGQRWDEGSQRRAIGGTLAKAGTIYRNAGGASGISDLAGHEQQNGELLGGPYFPKIYPNRIPEEEEARAKGKLVGRSPKKILALGITLASNAGKYFSFSKVVGKKD